jgi:hypothetical protein
LVENLLDIDSRRRVCAASHRRVVLRISLEVDVEAVAASHSRTLLCTGRRIIRVHQSVTGILVGGVGSSQGGESLNKSGRNLSSNCLGTVPSVGSESSCSIRERDVADTERLLDTSTVTLDQSGSRSLSDLRGRADSGSDICRRVEDGGCLGVAGGSGLGRSQSGGSQSRSTLSSDIDDGKNEDGGRDGHGDGIDVDGGGRLSTCNSGKGCDGSGESGTHLGGLGYDKVGSGSDKGYRKEVEVC